MVCWFITPEVNPEKLLLSDVNDPGEDGEMGDSGLNGVNPWMPPGANP